MLEKHSLVVSTVCSPVKCDLSERWLCGPRRYLNKITCWPDLAIFSEVLSKDSTLKSNYKQPEQFSLPCFVGIVMLCLLMIFLSVWTQELNSKLTNCWKSNEIQGASETHSMNKVKGRVGGWQPTFDAESRNAKIQNLNFRGLVGGGGGGGGGGWQPTFDAESQKC